MNNESNNFAFVLGRERDLALEELGAVLNRFNFCFDPSLSSSGRQSHDPGIPASSAGGQDRKGYIYKITGNVAFAKIDNFSKDDAAKIIDVLAGTIKIFQLNNCHSDPVSLVERSEESSNKRSLDFARDDNQVSFKIQKQVQHDMNELILELSKNKTNKFNFGISSYNKSFGKSLVNRMGLETKNFLKSYGLKTRFVQLQEGNDLTSIQSLKNGLDSEGFEVGVFDGGIGHLIALNNPEKWAQIDYDKPAADKYSGMLPPRLARTMINLALGQISIQSSVISAQENSVNRKTQIENCKLVNCKFDDTVVIDSFCGSGAVLLEGLQLGLPVIGSDISEKAVRDSKTNVEWLLNQYPVLSNQYSVFQADATSTELIENCKLKIVNYKNIVFVSEPYLGKPKKFKSTLNATFAEYKEIKTLCVDFLKNIKQLAEPVSPVIPSVAERSFDSKISPTVRQGSRGRNDKKITVCLIFPAVETSDSGRFSLFAKCVDEIKNLGYTQVRNSFSCLGSETNSRLIYGRDYQIVKREIVLLQLKQK